MTTLIKIGDVDNPTHVQCAVFADLGNERQILQEAYAGSILVGLSNGGAPVSRADFKSFLPVSKNTIRTYAGVDTIRSALVVTLSGFNATEDEEFIAAVDDFEVVIEQQAFPSVPGTPPCLILKFSLGLLNGTISRVGYSVTVQTPRSSIEDIDVSRSTRPA
jgi:hypothetical protein